MNAPDPRISVVVCTYNRVALLGEALQSLADQVLHNSLYEVLVINNNSTDGTQALAEGFVTRYGNFRVILEVEQGLSHARNRGWSEARGDYVAYVDDDAKAAPNWCEKILQAFESVTPRPKAVGGQIKPWYEGSPPQWFTDDLETRSWGEESGWLDPGRYPSGFSGSNMAFKRSILEDNRGFSTDYGMVGNSLRMGEDAELFSRLHGQRECLWYDPEIIVYHWVPVRNYRLFYRFRRMFKIGVAASSMEKEGGRSFAAKLCDLFWLIYKLPKRFSGKQPFKKKFCLYTQELGYCLGKLCSKR